MFDTWSTLLVVAIAFSIISLKWYNLIFSFVAMLGWIALWAYNMDNPPVGIVQGSFVHEVLMYSFILMAIVIMLLYFRTRVKSIPNARNGIDTENLPTETKVSANMPKGLMDLSTEEYRKAIKGALRSGKRK